MRIFVDIDATTAERLLLEAKPDATMAQRRSLGTYAVRQLIKQGATRRLMAPEGFVL